MNHLDEAEFPDAIDWLSEEKYNLMKEKYNNCLLYTSDAADE